MLHVNDGFPLRNVYVQEYTIHTAFNTYYGGGNSPGDTVMRNCMNAVIRVLLHLRYGILYFIASCYLRSGGYCWKGVLAYTRMSMRCMPLRCVILAV